jgi:hypothetical protein
MITMASSVADVINDFDDQRPYCGYQFVAVPYVENMMYITVQLHMTFYWISQHFINFLQNRKKLECKVMQYD